MVPMRIQSTSEIESASKHPGTGSSCAGSMWCLEKKNVEAAVTTGANVVQRLARAIAAEHAGEENAMEDR